MGGQFFYDLPWLFPVDWLFAIDDFLIVLNSDVELTQDNHCLSDTFLLYWEWKLFDMQACPAGTPTLQQLVHFFRHLHDIALNVNHRPVVVVWQTAAFELS